MTFSTKIVWISDLHMTESGMVEGVDCRANLRHAIRTINEKHGDAVACIATGDLTDTGSPEEYATLLAEVASLEVPLLPLIGNHDGREEFLRAIELPGDAQDGYAQFRVDIGPLTLMCLDTHAPGTDSGGMDERRLDWLSDQLADCRDQSVLIFMHHPPGPLGLGPLDDMPLEEPAAFLDLISNAPQVRHLFIGHVHRPVSGSIRGIPFTTLRALAHQTKDPYHSWDWESFVSADERPEYGVILIADDRIVVQSIDLMAGA